MIEKVAVIGSGSIACGLAAVAAARLGEAVLIARSKDSAARATARTDQLLTRMEADGKVRVTSDMGALADATYVVEAIAEELDCKCEILSEANRIAPPDAILATTTSSLSVETIANACGRPGRFLGLHVFNPVPKMELIEVGYATDATEDVRERTRELCEALGKTAVEVPDIPGFVVNHLLFDMLFDAVRLMEAQDMRPEDIDTCMTLGAGHPMGPFALLDFVGIDVSIAIGEQINADIPPILREMAAEGRLGKKAGRGFYAYDAVPVKK